MSTEGTTFLPPTPDSKVFRDSVLLVARSCRLHEINTLLIIPSHFHSRPLSAVVDPGQKYAIELMGEDKYKCGTGRSGRGKGLRSETDRAQQNVDLMLPSLVHSLLLLLLWFLPHPPSNISQTEPARLALNSHTNASSKTHNRQNIYPVLTRGKFIMTCEHNLPHTDTLLRRGRTNKTREEESKAHPPQAVPETEKLKSSHYLARSLPVGMRIGIRRGALVAGNVLL